MWAKLNPSICLLPTLLLTGNLLRSVSDNDTSFAPTPIPGPRATLVRPHLFRASLNCSMMLDPTPFFH